jgi:replicative DNA helicase
VTAAKPSVGRVAAAAAAKKNVDVLRNTFSVRVRVVLTKKKEKKRPVASSSSVNRHRMRTGVVMGRDNG